MNLAGNSLTEVAAAVATHLRERGIDSVVVGRSAVTAYVPQVSTSLDVDFVTSEGGRRVNEALAEIGFHLEGRVYVNGTTMYTVDIVDRLSAFLHWSDGQSLDVAQRAVHAARDRIDVKRLRAAINALSAPDAPTKARLAVARAHVEEALGEA